MFDTVLVAGRGLATRRVVRSCQALSIRALTVHVEADARAAHAVEADESLLLGDAPEQAYLDLVRLLEAARQGGADAVHPAGTGLGRDPAAAQAVLAAGLGWVGPPPDVLRRLAASPPVPAGDRGRSVDVPVLAGDGSAVVLHPCTSFVDVGAGVLTACDAATPAEDVDADPAAAAVHSGARGLLRVARPSGRVRPGLDLADPVSDAVHATDLVALALHVAAGRPPGEVAPAAAAGAAVQVLVHATADGHLEVLDLPAGEGVLAESAWRRGDNVRAGELVCALTTWGSDAAARDARCLDVLDALTVGGVPHDLVRVREMLGQR